MMLLHGHSSNLHGKSTQFYNRATRMHGEDYAVVICLSVRLSQTRILSKRLKYHQRFLSIG